MNILGIGPLELLFILLIVILVLNPEDISKIARSAGRTLNRIVRSDEWRTVNRAARDLRDLPNQLMREARIEEIQELKHDLKETERLVNSETRSLNTRIPSINLPDPHPGARSSSEPGQIPPQDTAKDPPEAHSSTQSQDHAGEKQPSDQS